MKKNIWDYSFQEIPQAYYEAWMEHAKAKANREMIDESKKSVLSKIMWEVNIPEWMKDTESYRERIARCSDEYREYLKVLQNTVQTESEWNYRTNSLKMAFEWYRSMNALEKEKTKIL